MRTVLLGMNNPQGREALLPDPPGCTGHRIWRMIHERTGCSQQEYMDAFDRRNVLEGSTVWDISRACAVAQYVWLSLSGRRVVILGQEVRRVMRLPAVRSLRWSVSDGVEWCVIPHPSGLNRWYNSRVCRGAVALRLEQLYLSAVSS